MHNIPQSTRVTLHTRSGEVMSYPSLAEAVLQLEYRWLAENLGRQFTERRPAYWSDKDQRWVSEVRKHYCILRDAAGERLANRTARLFAQVRLSVELGLFAEIQKPLDRL